MQIQSSIKLSRFCWVLFVGLLFSMSLTLSGCGGGGGSSSNTSGVSAKDVSGKWSVHEVVNESACGLGNETNDYNVTVVQSGAQITLTDSNGNTYTGSVNGSTISWKGSFSRDGGTVTITSMTLTLSSDGDSLNGTANWTWTGSGKTCSGTTQITATKTSGTYSNASLEGTWIETSVTPSSTNVYDQHAYMIFDGNGQITDFGEDDFISGVYSVADKGTISFSFNTMSTKNGSQTVSLTGNITSSTTFTMAVIGSEDGSFTMTFTKIDDLSICAGNWSGTLVETTGGNSHPISFSVDSSGSVTSFSGFTLPATGRMFSLNGQVTSFFRTADTSEKNAYSQFFIWGPLSSNAINGSFVTYQTDIGGGNIQLTRQ